MTDPTDFRNKPHRFSVYYRERHPEGWMCDKFHTFAGARTFHKIMSARYVCFVYEHYPIGVPALEVINEHGAIRYTPVEHSGV